MSSRETVVDEPIYASSLEAGDVFVFETDAEKREYVVLRAARGERIEGRERCFFIHFLPCLVLHQIRNGGDDVVTRHRRLLCCMREDPDQPHLLVIVVGRNPVVRELAETTSL